MFGRPERNGAPGEAVVRMHLVGWNMGAWKVDVDVRLVLPLGLGFNYDVKHRSTLTRLLRAPSVLLPPSAAAGQAAYSQHRIIAGGGLGRQPKLRRSLHGIRHFRSRRVGVGHLTLCIDEEQERTIHAIVSGF